MQKRNNILIVDDEKTVREILKSMILDICKEKSISIIESDNGINAMIKTGNQKFDLIITDLKMPKKDGQSFIEDILTQKRIDPDKIIVVTGNINPEEIKALYQLGIKNIILKPFTQEQISHKLNVIIS